MHNSLQMALEAYLSHGCSQRTATKLRHQLNRWYRHGGHHRCAAITVADFESFRQSCAQAGLSVATIEDTVKDVASILKAAGYPVDTGRRLRMRVRCKPVPTSSDLDALYAAADVAQWPAVKHPKHWWRAWIVLAAWTGFRRARPGDRQA